MLTVFLRHDLPDGTWHVDWLIEVLPTPEDRVPTFRLRGRPDSLGSFEGEMLDEHRRHYLSYEGPVLGDRGAVRRLGSAEVLAVRGWPAELDLQARMGGVIHQWEGRPLSGVGVGGVWRFRHAIRS